MRAIASTDSVDCNCESFFITTELTRTTRAEDLSSRTWETSASSRRSKYSNSTVLSCKDSWDLCISLFTSRHWLIVIIIDLRVIYYRASRCMKWITSKKEFINHQQAFVFTITWLWNPKWFIQKKKSHHHLIGVEPTTRAEAWEWR